MALPNILIVAREMYQKTFCNSLFKSQFFKIIKMIEIRVLQGSILDTKHIAKKTRVSKPKANLGSFAATVRIPL